MNIRCKLCKILTMLYHVNRINILNIVHIKIFLHYTIRRNYKNMYVGDELMAYTSSKDWAQNPRLPTDSFCSLVKASHWVQRIAAKTWMLKVTWVTLQCTCSWKTLPSPHSLCQKKTKPTTLQPSSLYTEFKSLVLVSSVLGAGCPPAAACLPLTQSVAVHENTKCFLLQEDLPYKA